MTDRKPETDRVPTDVGAQADAALDHALREKPVDEEVELDFGEEPDVAASSNATAAQDGGEEEDDYVLYSEVRPHLEALVALQKERDKLINLLLYARDRVSSPAAASRMDDGLSQLGIQVIHPAPGERFNPSQHEASATVQTDDRSKHGLIAEVELAGYIDGERVVRAPIVTVYSADAPETK